MNSVWEKDYINKSLPTLTKNNETPLIIIGGGLAGLTCAYYLMKNNIKFILVEGKQLAKGVSLNTTAQVSIAHDDIINKIEQRHGIDTAIKYIELQNKGLNMLKDTIFKENINCDFKEESSILCTSENKTKNTLTDQINILNQTNIDYKFNESKNKILNYKYSIEFKNQFIINPIKYLMGIIDILLSKKIKLYENSKVTKIKKNNSGYEVIVNNSVVINTNKIIMACHYPILNPDNLYFTKMYQSKSYALSFKTKLKLDANYISLDKPYFYLRTYGKNRLIIGGCDHFTGDSVENNYSTLIDKVKQLDKNATIGQKWFTEDCMVIDYLPMVGRYSSKNPNIFIVSGFLKWGFSNSHVAADIIKDLILNKEVDNIFSPSRTVLTKDIKNTCRMVNHSIDGLLLSKLKVKSDELNNIKIGSGKVMLYENRNVLVYRESEKKYIMLQNKCTHLGCSLIWNDIDKVWESKCHGTIYDRYGHVIYGPGIKDLTVIDINKPRI